MVLTLDSDLLALGCYDFITDGILSATARNAYVRGFTRDRLVKRGKEIFGIGRDVDCRMEDTALLHYLRQLFCCLSCLVGNDYIHGAMPHTEAQELIRRTFVDGSAPNFGRPVYHNAYRSWK